MGVHMILKDALIIGKEGEDPIKYKVSNRTGKETAYFCVGVNQYDPTYEGNYHYNNFFVSVPSDRIAMIRKLKLRRNSLGVRTGEPFLLSDFVSASSTIVRFS